MGERETPPAMRLQPEVCLRHPQIQHPRAALASFSKPHSQDVPFDINIHSARLPVNAGPDQLSKMVQYYNVAGAKVGSHYVSSCAPLLLAAASNVRDASHEELSGIVPVDARIDANS